MPRALYDVKNAWLNWYPAVYQLSDLLSHKHAWQSFQDPIG